MIPFRVHANCITCSIFSSESVSQRCCQSQNSWNNKQQQKKIGRLSACRCAIPAPTLYTMKNLSPSESGSLLTHNGKTCKIPDDTKNEKYNCFHITAQPKYRRKEQNNKKNEQRNALCETYQPLFFIHSHFAINAWTQLCMRKKKKNRKPNVILNAYQLYVSTHIKRMPDG